MIKLALSIKDQLYTGVGADSIPYIQIGDGVKQIAELPKAFLNNGVGGGGDVTTEDLTDAITAHNTATDSHQDIRNELSALKNLGDYVGSFDTVALRPANISGFTVPTSITIGDFVTIRADENYDGVQTMYRIIAIDGGTGAITWDYAASFSSDVTGKADKVTSATEGNLAGLDADGNLTDSGVAVADLVTNETVDEKIHNIDRADYASEQVLKGNTDTFFPSTAIVGSTVSGEAYTMLADGEIVVSVDNSGLTGRWVISVTVDGALVALATMNSILGDPVWATNPIAVSAGNIVQCKFASQEIDGALPAWDVGTKLVFYPMKKVTTPGTSIVGESGFTAVDNSDGVNSVIKLAPAVKENLTKANTAVQPEVLTAHNTATDSHPDLRQRVESIENRGLHVGTYDTFADRPTNVSQFTYGANLNDDVIIRTDETQGNSPVRYIIIAIAEDGVLTYDEGLILSSNVAGAVAKTGDTMTGPLVAQANTDYAVAQVRNVIISNVDLTPGVSPLADGTIYLVYE